MDKKSYCIAWLMLLFVGSLHAQYRTTTYCNPLNLDYTYPFTIPIWASPIVRVPTLP